MKFMPKDKFVERIKLLLDDEKDVEEFFKYCITVPKKAIRANTLKITPDELRKRLEGYGWKVKQPFKDFREVMIVESELKPGEIGKTKEHILGYYYVQEITSMMPIFALNPGRDDVILDLCAAPGSKTTQSAAMMENQGNIIANDLSIGRISILSSNLERCGVTNTIVTRDAGSELCKKLKKTGFAFDKILVDAPCSGEGNIRCSPRTCLEWSEGLLKSLSRKQKKLLEEAWKVLKVDGELIYSTCTYSPEENESVVQHILDKFDVEIVDVKLPIKTRPGISEWKGENFSKELKKAKRIYHHDNNMEGFFVCKMKKLKN